MLGTLTRKIAWANILVVVLLVVAFGFLSYRACEVSLYRQIESETLAKLYAGVAGVERLDRADEVKTIALALSKSVGGRAIVLSGLGRIVADSQTGENLEGKLLSLDEVPSVLEGNTSTKIYRTDRGRHLYAAVPIEISGKVQGAAFVAVPLAYLDRVLIRVAWEIAVAAALTTFGAAILAIALSVFIGRPYARMVSALESAQSHDYRHRFPSWGRSDLARLARVFNSMADRLRRTEQARRDFVVEASRELEGPLERLISLAGAGSQDPGECLAEVSLTAQRMSRTVDELMSLARLEMRTDPMRIEPLEFGELLNEAIRSNLPVAASRGISLKRDDTIDSPIPIGGDRRRLLAALSALVHNAILTSGEGGNVRVSVALDTRNVLFSVNGSAPGLPPEDLPFVFERFLVRREESLTGDDPLPPGAGAGLALARRVIELHGGDIESKCGPDGGITFFARLPRRSGTE